MTTTALTLALEALEDARDDVDAALQHAESLKGYPRTDARHAAYVEQLEKHDAAIEALRAAIAQAAEPVAWAVEYGAVNLPIGDPARLTAWHVFASKDVAESYADRTDYETRILPVCATQDGGLHTPEIDYMALIEAAFKRHGHAKGSRGCVAFKHGAEWFRAQVHAARAAGEGG